MAASIRGVCTGDAYIDRTCTVSTWIRYAGNGGICTSSICTKSASVRSVEPGIAPRAILGLEVILAGPWVNEYCFILSISLIFALIDSTSYCSIDN